MTGAGRAARRSGAGYPVLIIPAAMAVAVAVHRLVANEPFDRPALVLGMLGVGAVALRESLAARDAAKYARRVVQQEAQFRSLIAGSTDVIMVLDADLIVRWQSAAAARQFGLSDQEVVGRHFQSMVHPDDAVLRRRPAGRGLRPARRDGPALIEARLRDGFGQWRETESSAADQRAVPEVGGIVVHVRDIGERKELERAMHRLAFADQLTGLANRRQMLLSIVAQRSAPRVRGVLLLIELDGFNAVNDVRGYDTGDAVLVEVARRLRAGTAETDLPARLGGDEFAVVTETSAVHAYALATRLLMMLAEPIVLPSVTVYLTASIGMADLAGGSNVDDVLRRADLALRQAKQTRSGPGGVVRRRGRGGDAAPDDAGAGAARRAAAGRARPHLPADHRPGRVAAPGGRGAAAVAASAPGHAAAGRRHPGRRGRRTDPRDRRLGAARSPGGSWPRWLGEGRDLSMAVNVSPHQLESAPAGRGRRDHARPARAAGRSAWCSRWPSPAWGPDLARIEEHLVQVRSLGVRTALDDFGTGPESLTHLRSLPMDMVKIGRTFFEETAGAAGAVRADHRGHGRPRPAARAGGGRPGPRGGGAPRRGPGGRLPARPGPPARPAAAGRAHRGLPGRLPDPPPLTPPAPAR